MSDKPKIHGPKSPRWRGNPRQYQIEAQRKFAIERERGVLPWSWVSTNCDVEQCLDVDCMTLRTATKIAYPTNICTYCGEPGWTRDHLLPEPMTGGTLRHLVAVVPACGGCNSRIGDLPSANVAERRQVSQLRIEQKHKRLLLVPQKTDAELLELSHTMRSVAVKNNIKRLRIKAQLGWPIDPNYDLRAFTRSGIEDPESLGLCDRISKPLREEYREYAVEPQECA